ncbi:MAG TPA: ABC transporter ATP-binding protein [Anaerolineae bacterium]
MWFSCSRLSKEFKSRNGRVLALDGVTFEMHQREFVCVVGPSGCGKTTLLRIIAGLVEPTAGVVSFDSVSPVDRLRTALVFQEHGLFPWMSVIDNVAFGLEMHGVTKKERYSRASAFIEKVGLGSFANRYPHELSVGMRQRVGVARAFVSDPEVLLLDEPFGSLDAQTRLVLQDELLRIWTEYRKTVILVTHDIEEAVRLADRVLVMTGRPGRIREEIPIPFERPRDFSSGNDRRVTEIKSHIWKMLEDEVRKNLWVPV